MRWQSGQFDDDNNEEDHHIDPSPTIYRGTPVRSRLEADAIALLDELLSKHFSDDVWAKHLFRYEGPGYRNRRSFYKPDWIFTWSDSLPETKIFFEIKPDKNDLAPADLLDRMHCVRDSVPNAQLVLLIGMWDTFERRYQFDWPPKWFCMPKTGCAACQAPEPPPAVTIEDLL